MSDKIPKPITDIATLDEIPQILAVLPLRDTVIFHT
jgi:hypothetical protein